MPKTVFDVHLLLNDHKVIFARCGKNEDNEGHKKNGCLGKSDADLLVNFTAALT